MTLVVGTLVPFATPLIGMLMLGNLMKESGVVERITDARGAVLFEAPPPPAADAELTLAVEGSRLPVRRVVAGPDGFPPAVAEPGGQLHLRGHALRRPAHGDGRGRRQAVGHRRQRRQVHGHHR